MWFSTPELVFWDSLRILSAVSCIVSVGLTPYALQRPAMKLHHKLRMLGTVLIAFVIVDAYLDQLGTLPPVPWRMVVVVIGALLGAAGQVLFLVQERREQPT